MSDNKENVPKLRFPGFTDAWEQRELSQLVDVRSGRDYKHLADGDIPVYGTGGYMLSVSEALSYNQDAIGIGRKGTIDKPYILKAPFWTVDTLFYAVPKDRNDLDFIFNIFQKVNWKQKDESTGVPSLSKVAINSVQVIAPDYKEQKAIGEFFTQLDNLITLHQRKLNNVKNMKAGLLQKMVPKDGEDFPEVRFPGFTDAWEQRKLGEVSPLRGGFAFKSELFTKVGVPIVKISNILSNGDVGGEFDHYDELEQDENFILPDKAAVLAMSGATTGKVSILDNPNRIKIYQNQRVGYFTDIGVADYTFISTVVRSDLFADKLKSVLVSGAQPNVSSKEIDTFEFFMPSEKEEQTQIGNFFKHIDNLITLHQRKLDNLQQLKKSLLQQMFV
ncbi:restriction endonuclease subunit S [Paenibacillus pinistramenti]|uniref:restriction endonuclease subunit S n=1 Tax=Paenibacillus pinistramenti TaxID=1768003 RepID=UPI001108A264|nr:restriction endonuclease subunit S [Paenibacillus pinistramenti]